MKTKKTSVTLISWTQHPLETIYAEWQQSRSTDPILSAEGYVRQAREEYSEAGIGMGSLYLKMEEVFEKVIAMRMPLGESIGLVFMLEHIPVALREQLVRHRIGHKFGEQIGADVVPDLAGGSSFWSQTTRILDMSHFADDGEFLKPDWLEENGKNPMGGILQGLTVEQYYERTMKQIQAAYTILCEAGMPMEDSRNVLPIALQHRMTWTTNLSAVMHLLSKRGCWFAQLGMWEPVIHGIVNELATRIHPTFRRLIDPPCFNAEGAFQACTFEKENEHHANKPVFPPCTLWVNKQALPRSEAPCDEMDLVHESQRGQYRRLQTKFSVLWCRDPKTGERKKVG